MHEYAITDTGNGLETTAYLIANPNGILYVSNGGAQIELTYDELQRSPNGYTATSVVAGPIHIVPSGSQWLVRTGRPLT